MCFMLKWIYNTLQLANSPVAEHKTDEDSKMKLWDTSISTLCLYMLNAIKHGNLKKKAQKFIVKTL